MASPDVSLLPYHCFDALSLGYGVLRDGRLVYANAAMLRLLGRSAEEALGQRAETLIAAPLTQEMRERNQARRRGEPVPDTYETTLCTPQGERLVEMSVALNGGDTVVVLKDLTARVAHRAVLQQVAELGAGLSSARTEAEVLQRVFSGLEALGLTFCWQVPDGERMRVVHSRPAPALARDAELVALLKAACHTGGRTPLQEKAWREGSAHGDDFALEVSRCMGAGHAEPARAVLRRAGPLHLILVRVDVEGAPRALLMLVAEWLREEELAPLRLFGAQVSAALEAARTISSLSARNTALAALNRLAIAATTATEPAALYAAGAEEITALLGCDAFTVFLRSEDGEALERAYSRGFPEAHLAALPRLPLEGPLAGEVLRDGVARVLDVADCPPFTREQLGRLGFATVAVFPLRVRSHAMGTLVLCFRQRRALSALERETLQSLGSHFAAASEAHRLLREVRGRAEHLALIHEMGRSLVGTVELPRVLEAGIEALALIVDVPDAYIFLLEPERQRLVIRAAVGGHPELLGRFLPTEPPDSSLAARALHTRDVIRVEDVRGDGSLKPALLESGGIAFLALPLVVHERPVGVAVLVDPRHPRRFSVADVERTLAIANQLALALDGARLVDNLQKSYAELARAHQQLVQRERLAALGELSAVVAHEVRNPLGAIFNSVATLRRIVGANSPTVPLLDILGEEAERLNRIVDDLLNFARPSSPAPQPVSLERLLEEAVRRALADATGSVEVEWALETSVPQVPVDERMMRQAFLNLALNAVQAMTHGGVLRVAVRGAARERSGVEVEFTDTGPGIPPEVRTRIFEPFFTTKAKGTGLGLALVKRIIDSHYGKLAVESPTRGGTTFRIFLPREQDLVAPPLPLSGD